VDSDYLFRSFVQLSNGPRNPWFAEGLAELYGWIRDSGLCSEVTKAAEQLLEREAIPFRQFAIDERSAWLE
jgi:hypothetical protein